MNITILKEKIKAEKYLAQILGQQDVVFAQIFEINKSVHVLWRRREDNDMHCEIFKPQSRGFDEDW